MDLAVRAYDNLFVIVKHCFMWTMGSWIECLCSSLIMSFLHECCVVETGHYLDRIELRTFDTETRMCHVWILVLAWLLIGEVFFTADQGCTCLTEASKGQLKWSSFILRYIPRSACKCWLKLLATYILEFMSTLSKDDPFQNWKLLSELITHQETAWQSSISMAMEKRRCCGAFVSFQLRLVYYLFHN